MGMMDSATKDWFKYVQRFFGSNLCGRIGSNECATKDMFEVGSKDHEHISIMVRCLWKVG